MAVFKNEIDLGLPPKIIKYTKSKKFSGEVQKQR